MKWTMTMVLALAGIGLQAASPAPAGSGRVSGGFKAPVFDEKGELRTQFEGEGFRPLKDGRFLITKFQLKTFRAQRQPEMTAVAEECFFRQADHSASSPGHLKVTQADGKLELEGVGFEWRQKSGQLVLSNRVEAVLRPPAGRDDAEMPIKVQADRLEYDSRLSIAIFMGSVNAEQSGRIRLSCERLTATLGVEGGGFERIEAEDDVRLALTEGAEHYEASGRQALFIADKSSEGNDRLDLRGGAQFKARGLEGGADQLLITSSRKRQAPTAAATPIIFEAQGQARLRMPLPVGSNPGKTNWVEIDSERYTFRDARADFQGRVNARSENQWTLRAGRLQVFQGTGTNRLERIVAEDSVEIDLIDLQSRGQLRGAKAEFEESGGWLTLAGGAEWQMREYRGKGGQVRLKVTSPSPDVVVAGGSTLVLPGQMVLASGLIPDLSGFQAKPVPPSIPLEAAEAEIQSSGMMMREGRVTFSGPVKVKTPAGTLDAQNLNVVLDEEGKRARRIAADGNVVIRQNQDRMEALSVVAEMSAVTNRLDRLVAEGGVKFLSSRSQRFLRGEGERLTLTPTNQLALLEGNPRFTTESGLWVESGEPVHWNMDTRKFRLKDYVVSGRGDSLKKTRGAPSP